MSTPEIRVYAKVVADLFHHGHVRFFQAARELGTHLTVGVVSDERVAAYKGRLPVLSHAQRCEIVASCRWVDEVMGDGPKEISRAFMDDYGFQIYAFGADGEAELAHKLQDCIELPESMRRVLPYSPEISTRSIRARIRGEE